MKLFRFAMYVALSGLFLIGPPESQAEEKARVLMITQSAGFRHGSVNRGKKDLAPAEIAMVQLGKQTGLFSVETSSRPHAQDQSRHGPREGLMDYLEPTNPRAMDGRVDPHPPARSGFR